MADYRWYVAIAKVGYDRKMMRALVERSQKDMDGIIQQVVMLVHRRIEIVRGKPVIKEELLFPNYIYVRMIHTRESWYAVRNTTGCAGIAGGENPIDTPDEELQKIFHQVGLDVPFVTEQPFPDGTQVVADDRTPLAGVQGVVVGFDVPLQELHVRVTLPEGTITVPAPYGLWKPVER